jgi:hypothetical protein
VLIGDTLGDQVGNVYKAAVTRCKKKHVPVVLALSPKLSEWREKLVEHAHARVLGEPVTLRAIRTALQQMHANGSEAAE